MGDPIVVVLSRPYSFASSLAYSPDGKWIAIGGPQEERNISFGDFQVCIRIWDVESARFSEKSLKGFDVRALVINPNGAWIGAVGGQDINLWNPSNGERRTLTGHQNDVRCIAFDSSGVRLALASADHTARIWST